MNMEVCFSPTCLRWVRTNSRFHAPIIGFVPVSYPGRYALFSWHLVRQLPPIERWNGYRRLTHHCITDTPTGPITAPIFVLISTSGPYDDVYRPSMCTLFFSTPGSDGSMVVLLTEDLRFSTDEYYVSGMVPSALRSAANKKGAKKKKAQMGESSDVRPRRLRCVYTTVKSMAIAKCSMDITKDPVVANNQEEGSFWGRIGEKYEEIKPPKAKSHGPEKIRKHWDRIMKECGRFNAIYTNVISIMGSG